MERIVFVADVFTPFSAKSSTQMVIYSLLFAIKQKCSDMLFIGLYRSEDEKSLIESFLAKERIKYILIKAKIDMESTGKLSTFTKLYRSLLQNHKKELDLKTFNSDDNKIKIVVSIPSLESFAVAGYLHKKISPSVLNTVWTDVVVLNSLNNYKKIPFGRKMLKPIESKVLRLSSKNFFLGEQQLKVMSSFYQKYAMKMDYYYPSYYPFFSYLDDDYKNIERNNNVLYFGDLNPSVRNIYPLYLSSNFTDAHIKIVGKGVVSVNSIETSLTEYIPLKKRVSTLSEALKIEKSSFISVCVLNRCGFSLPGKLFYYTELERPILVIKDGPFANDIENQLKAFNRFTFCENEPKAIAEAIDLIRKENKQNNNYNAFDPNTTFLKIID